MAHALYTNNAVATLASGISAGDTSATLTAGQGALFPNPLTGNYFWGTLNDAATGLVIEIVQVTARATDTLTIVRAQQGTTANAYLAGDKFELRVTAQGLQDLQPISELGAAAYDNIVTIANGGTNSSSYTAPAGGISPLVYYDGTKFSTDAIVADAGYNTSTNTINSTNFVASANLSGTSLKLGYQSIATNGGTTTFTVTSPYYTIFTGTQSQTVVLPDATTLSVGWKYGVDNDSTQSITINANGGGAFWIVAPGCDLYITLSSNASAAGTWEKDYNAAKVANGKGVTINNSLTLSGTDGTTMTFPSSSSTVVTTSTLSGGTLAASTTSLTDSGNLTFTGTGNRITGDFSNATTANRVAVQTSTTNGNTVVGFVPNGSSNTAALNCYNTADPTNSSIASIRTAATEVSFYSTISGTGTYLPMTFFTGGSERLRIDTSGNVGIGNSTIRGRLDVSDGTVNTSGDNVYQAIITGPTRAATSTASAIMTVQSNDALAANIGGGIAFGGRYLTASTAAANWAFISGLREDAVSSNLGGYLQFSTRTAAGSVSERMRIDSSGNVGIGTAASSFGGANLQVTNATVASVLVSDTTHIGEMLTTSGGVSLGTRSNHTLTLVSNDTARATLDTTGNFLLTSTGGLGYGTGAGNTRTQTPSKSTTVDFTTGTGHLNPACGQITMSNAALAANTTVTFQLNNSTIAATDCVIVNMTGVAGSQYNLWASDIGSGSCQIQLKNITGGSLSEAVKINFAVIKAAIT